MIEQSRLWSMMLALALMTATAPAQAERGWRGEQWSAPHAEKVRWRGGGHGGHGHDHHGGRFRGHFFIGLGLPLFWPWYEPGYARPYPQTVVVPQTPPVYVERGDGAGAPAQDYYWYYCRASGAYYPYVKSCATAWQRVAPQPPDAQ
ncbi:MAG: hypothetical protein KDH15_16485 [Rhodocyclaceae bacterium]|nr:hypothetical protein [Rhodocyclaceae bacterium]